MDSHADVSNSDPTRDPNRLRVLSSTPSTIKDHRRFSRHSIAQTAGLTQAQRRKTIRQFRSSRPTSAAPAPTARRSLADKLRMASLNSARRHASISGAPHSRKTPTGEAPPNQDGSSTPPQPLENSDNEEVLQQPYPGQPPHSYVHGHLPGVPWSAELDAIKAPELLESHPEALFTFKLAYERYCKQLFDVSERHNTTIPPKPVIDCVEE